MSATPARPLPSAFAAATSRDVPTAAPLLLPLAAIVAYSRAYLGVHHPSDVAAGGAPEAGIGVASRSVAARPAGTDNVLGILPVGTGRGFARSLGIPIKPSRAGELLGGGDILCVGLGRPTCPGQPSASFVHAATVGLNVDFTELATARPDARGSAASRIWRPAVDALRERGTFRCTLNRDGGVDELALVHLSAMSAGSRARADH